MQFPIFYHKEWQASEQEASPHAAHMVAEAPRVFPQIHFISFNDNLATLP